MVRDAAGRIAERLREAGGEAPAAVVEPAARFYELLYRWNGTVNLTALLDGDEAIDRLIVEPLVAGQALPGHGLLVDVGSGGGSPAIPLKLTRPAMGLLMVESRARKGAFLREATRHLGLTSVSVETRRLEDLANGGGWDGAAAVVSVRAVRLDEGILRAVARLGGPGVRLWVFAARHDPGTSPGWELESSRELVVSRGSVLRVYRRR